MNICQLIAELVEYGINKKILPVEEKIYATNCLLEIFHKDIYNAPEQVQEKPLDIILNSMLDYAFSENLIEENTIACRDLFDTKIMSCLTPRPKQVIDTFYNKYEKNPEDATNYFYDLSKATNYIRTDRIKRDKKWVVPSLYGDIEVTINLSKPEKDPKEIEAAGKTKSGGYPLCLLCPENEGYAGRRDHPARQTLRVIPLVLNFSEWGFQYSPYVYYNEHCIVFDRRHVPMKMNRDVFQRLLDFVQLFPHYFIGSNADIPIVGGSILSHDHFQGGRHEFPMAKAPIEEYFTIPGFEMIESGIVKWPLSVIRLRCKEKEKIIQLGEKILNIWREYRDEEAGILDSTNGEQHNSITPIARKNNDYYELDLTLRNNRTDEKHPWGIFHPNEKLHHIKKENIGLIEVMGLAVLPGRLKKEMDLMSEKILEDKDFKDNPYIGKHYDWFLKWRDTHSITKDTIQKIIEDEIGRVFVKVLEDAGVFKCSDKGREDFRRFIHCLKIN